VTAPQLRGGNRPLLFPRSLAVVGASDRTAESAAELQQVLRGGVHTWFVNPNRPSVLGRECFASLTALPEQPECAYLLVGHTRAEAAFEDVIAAGVRAAVLPGLGAEAGAEGRAVAARIGTRAAECDVAVVGPNCMGIATPGGVSLWLGTVGGPEQFVPGHVSCVAHSGSIGEAFLASGPRVGYRTVVSAGGELSRDIADFVGYLAEDERTRAIGLFVETIRRPDAFAAALARAADAGKPVVCLKVGRSQAAARAALAHSGAVVGSARAFSALLRHHGALEVSDFHELLETLEVLGRRRWPRGLRIAAVSESGGECGLLADHGEEAAIPFAPFDSALQARLVEAFPNFTQPENPLDCWAIDAYEHVFPGTLSILRETGSYDVLLAQLDLSRHRGAHEEGWCAFVTAALADAVEGTDLEPRGLLRKFRVFAVPREVPEGAKHRGVRAIGRDHAADDLRGEHIEGDPRSHGGCHAGFQALVLALQDSEDRGLEQRVLVPEPAIDGARREARVLGDSRDRRSFDPMLSEHFGRGFEQLAQGLPAALLLWFQAHLGLGHGLLIPASWRKARTKRIS
jgi:acetyltransferase